MKTEVESAHTFCSRMHVLVSDKRGDVYGAIRERDAAVALLAKQQVLSELKDCAVELIRLARDEQDHEATMAAINGAFPLAIRKMSEKYSK